MGSWTFYLVLEILEESKGTLHQYNEQAAALKFYIRCERAILYAVSVGEEMDLREILRTENLEAQP